MRSLFFQFTATQNNTKTKAVFIKKSLVLFSTVVISTSCSKDGGTTMPGNPGGSDGSGNSSEFNVTVSTIAGKFGDKGNAEDGNGSNARFWNPTKMIYDSRNNMLYIADGTVIRSMDAQNNVKTYVPLGAIGSSYNEVLDIDLAPDEGGSLYVITKENDLWKIEPNGSNSKALNIVNRIYGGNETGVLNSGNHFDHATGITTGANGEIYFFNESWNTLHRIILSSNTTGTVESFAGKPLTESGGDGNAYPFQDGTGETATFGSRVGDIASDDNGNVYVADFDNELVRKVTPAGIVSSLFHYSNKIGIDVDGPVSAATSNSVTRVAANHDGSYVFFTSYGTVGNNLSSLRLIRPGKDVTTLAGSGSHYGDGTGKTAGLAEIGGIASTPDGKTIYISEPGNKVIRKVVLQ